jgi:hypothetical protein
MKQVNIPDLLNRMEACYQRMSAENDAKPVLLEAAETIVELARQLREAYADRPRIVVP